ncbi:hypothetical protein H5410_030864 [Solanum commersonii]|uniref:Uncharacterized protein n=1 Tax=Solanum commersonii TaxID=4109 RepID=A0A9J5YKL3_SOLCO|nr:hypothetical protein H5410_030864 [Solanum commersonii]
MQIQAQPKCSNALTQRMIPYSHNDSQFKASESNAILTLTKMNIMHNFTHMFTRIFQSTLTSAHSRSQRSFKDCNGAECKVVGRYGTASWNCLATRRLLHCIANLTFSFRAQRTGTKGDLQANRRLANWAQRSSGIHFFVLLSRLVPFCQVVSMFCLKLQIPET